MTKTKHWNNRVTQARLAQRLEVLNGLRVGTYRLRYGMGLRLSRATAGGGETKVLVTDTKREMLGEMNAFIHGVCWVLDLKVGDYLETKRQKEKETKQ